MTALVHPFKTERKRLEFDEGTTVKDMVLYAQPDAYKIRHAIVFINGRVIPKNIWGEHKPKSGELVEVRAFPIPHGGGGGGGKDILRVVLMIAVVALAMATGGAGLALMGFAPATIAAGGAWVTFAGAMWVGVVSAIGMIAINALCPVKTGALGQLSGTSTTDSNTLYIEGSSNSLKPFSPVPVILGKFRSTPPQGSKPYTEMIGNDQFIRMLFVWGIGPVEIDESSIKIGDTLLTDFSDYQIEHREGYSDDEPLTLFPSAISEEDFTIALKSVTDWVTRTTTIYADEISLDISFSNGLVEYDANGNKQSRSVNVEIEYRKTGSGDDWSKIDTSNEKFQSTVDASWLNKSYDLLDSITFTGIKTSASRYGIRWGVAERTQYDVRVRRTTTDTDSTMIADLTFWTALRSITAESPVNSPVPIAMTAIVIKATDQLNGIINNFSAVVTRVCKDWDVTTQTWIERATQNPASLFRFVLQGNGMALPLADGRIDLDTLQEWHEFCDLKGFKFNMIRDYTSSVWDTLRDICAAGRGAPTLIDGKWSVVIDQEQTAPVSVITPRNSFGMSGEKFFLDPPHGWRIQFSNEDQDYATDEYRVYRDGYNDSNATKFESLDLLGVTDPDQIYKLGRWRIAQVLNQPERWTFKQDMEFLTYRRGDWIKIAHDVMIVGLAQGRVKTVTLNEDTSVISVELDEEVTMETGKDYGVIIRTLDNPSLSAQVVTVEGVSKTLIFTDPIVGIGSPLEQAINIGDVFCFGEFGEETEDATVISISPNSNLQATIIAVPYRPAIYACDEEEIPAFVTKVTPHISIPAPNITSIVSGEDAMVVSATGTVKIRIGINYDPLDTTVWGTGSSIVVQIRHSGTEEAYYPAVIEEQGEGYVFIGDVRPDEVIDIRLRFKVNGRLLPGPWTTVLAYSVLGNAIPPADVTNFTYTFLKELVMSWDKNKLWGDLAGYEIRDE
ncbi:MAG: host specificity factor TipJ family phage tail protein, partial [Candidatus Paceibacterota bacterium]